MLRKINLKFFIFNNEHRKNISLASYNLQKALKNLKELDTDNKESIQITNNYQPLEPLKINIKPNILQKVQQKKYRESFLHIIFGGSFDPDVLLYPEIGLEDEKSIEYINKYVDKYFQSNINSDLIEKTNCIQDEHIQKFKQLNLYGLNIPFDYGGLNLSATAIAKLAETLSINTPIALNILTHNYFGAHGLTKCNNENIKSTYLPRMAKGEILATLALIEENSGMDINSIETTAAPLTGDDSKFVLTGKKTWVSNANKSDVFVTFARIKKSHLYQDISSTTDKTEGDELVAFLIDRNKTPHPETSISVSQPYSMVGLKGFNVCDVHFNGVIVARENIISEPGLGYSLAQDILSNTRFATSILYTGIIKKLTDEMLNKCNHTKSFDRKLSDYFLVQDRVGKISADLYAMESLTYLVASLKDDYLNYDSHIEDTLLRIFNGNKAFECLDNISKVYGREGLLSHSPIQRTWRDFKMMSILEGNSDTLKIEAALRGIKSRVLDLPLECEKTFKVRRYHLYPSHLFDSLRLMILPYWMERTGLSEAGDPKLSRDRDELLAHVHPTLAVPIRQLTLYLHDFHLLLRRNLQVHAREILHHQTILVYLAEYAAELFAMVAVISRSSRAKSIGLKNCDLEIDMTHAFCRHSIEKLTIIIDRMTELTLYGSNHESYRRIGEFNLKHNEYSAEHPLNKNW
ncbi:unnamed protein product [Gordionus sp. m RMFG-2023]